MDIHIVPIPEHELKPLFTNPDNLGFGDVYTDRMLTMTYTHGKGWHDPFIKKYQSLALDPATLVLHYGQEIFEGMKAFAAADGRIVFFRPDENVKRFNQSAKRMCMPELDEQEMLDGIIKLVSIEGRWIPKTRGSALYIRPTMIATEIGLGVRPANEYLYYVILSPVGPYFKAGFNPIRLFVTDKYVRAVEGGVGEAKTGGNYAASLLAKREATEKGCHEALWLDARERQYVEEVGAMNMFFVIDGVITTPSLTGAILHGITRKSVLTLAQHMGYKCEERRITITEILEGIETGRVSEAFGAGTAASIAPVGEICYKGKTYTIDMDGIGPSSQQFYDKLQAIQFGESDDPFGWTIKAPMA